MCRLLDDSSLKILYPRARVIKSEKEVDHILDFNLDSDFSNGLIFNYNEEELKQLQTNLDQL